MRIATQSNMLSFDHCSLWGILSILFLLAAYPVKGYAQTYDANKVYVIVNAKLENANNCTAGLLYPLEDTDGSKLKLKCADEDVLSARWILTPKEIDGETFYSMTDVATGRSIKHLSDNRGAGCVEMQTLDENDNTFYFKIVESSVTGEYAIKPYQYKDDGAGNNCSFNPYSNNTNNIGLYQYSSDQASRWKIWEFRSVVEPRILAESLDRDLLEVGQYTFSPTDELAIVTDYSSYTATGELKKNYHYLETAIDASDITTPITYNSWTSLSAEYYNGNGTSGTYTFNVTKLPNSELTVIDVTRNITATVTYEGESINVDTDIVAQLTVRPPVVPGSQYIVTNRSNFNNPLHPKTDDEGSALCYNNDRNFSNVHIWTVEMAEVSGEGYFYRFKNQRTNMYIYYDGTDIKMQTLDENNTGFLFKLGDWDSDQNFFGIIPYALRNADVDAVGVSFTTQLGLTLGTRANNSTWYFAPYEYSYTNYFPTIQLYGQNMINDLGTYTYSHSDFTYKVVHHYRADRPDHTNLIYDSVYHPDLVYTWSSSASLPSNTSVAVNGDDYDLTVASATSGSLNVIITLSDDNGVISNQQSSMLVYVNILADWQDITSLAAITNATGRYRLTADIDASTSFTTSIANFSGILDGQHHTITGLTVPLFTTLSNATVCNLTLDNVSISGTGNVGAIACSTSAATRIYNCGILASQSSTVSGTGYTGSIVGLLDGYSRVINCYSYADIIGGTTVGGIVGYNNYLSKATDLRTMVMNCMFYGDITGGDSRYPIYGGKIISNADATGVNNYNYFRKESSMGEMAGYNCALATEDRYLIRFEFYRGILNGNRELCAYYIKNSPDETAVVDKWVLDTEVAPYPILKTWGKYSSVINRPISTTTYQTINTSDYGWGVSRDFKADSALLTSRLATRYVGGQMGTLNVTISQGDNPPDGATINTTSLSLTITDMDTTHFDYGFRKVQLPYYNDLGTKNYTGNKVVTGWEISSVTGSTVNTYSTSVYNFADTLDTGKDLYGTSGRIFAQGGYYYVPKDVTGITIKPHWANAVYLSDPYYDVVYTKKMEANNFNPMGLGLRPTTFNNQTVYTSWQSAFSKISESSTTTVYDNAIVLVGNYHQFNATSAMMGNNNKKPYTMMSVDKNGDNEPDYYLTYQYGGRVPITSIRFDFLYSPGLGMAAKLNGISMMYNQGIYRVQGWFELTETCVIRFQEFEYASESKEAPLIMNGGIIEQFVSKRESNTAKTQYIHIGGNIWFKQFCNGTHSDVNYSTPHIPISVTGGQYEKFYLSGNFRPDAQVSVDNAVCYVNGGRFGEMAGAGQEQIKGDVTFKINHACIDEFYGGGINKQKPITGDIYVQINNSLVNKYVSGPKFGNMAASKMVTTVAYGTYFGHYYGAGNGGTSIYKTKPKDEQKDYPKDYLNQYNKGAYAANQGIATEYEMEYFSYAGGSVNNSRFYIYWSSFDKAQTKNVSSTLTNCIVRHNYYGGGLLGAVDGDVTSKLTNTIVAGNVFGAGFSAAIPTVDVYERGTEVPTYNGSTGAYTFPAPPAHTTYTWSNTGGTSSTLNDDANGNHLIYTNETLTGLGQVSGNVTLEINGDAGSRVYGSVYGGGDESAVQGSTTVTVDDNTIVGVHIFGGGNAAAVNTNTEVRVYDKARVYGNVYGGGNQGEVGGDTKVIVNGTVSE